MKIKYCNAKKSSTNLEENHEMWLPRKNNTYTVMYK